MVRKENMQLACQALNQVVEDVIKPHADMCTFKFDVTDYQLGVDMAYWFASRDLPMKYLRAFSQGDEGSLPEVLMFMHIAAGRANEFVLAQNLRKQVDIFLHSSRASMDDAFKNAADRTAQYAISLIKTLVSARGSTRCYPQGPFPEGEKQLQLNVKLYTAFALRLFLLGRNEDDANRVIEVLVEFIDSQASTLQKVLAYVSVTPDASTPATSDKQARAPSPEPTCKVDDAVAWASDAVARANDAVARASDAVARAASAEQIAEEMEGSVGKLSKRVQALESTLKAVVKLKVQQKTVKEPVDDHVAHKHDTLEKRINQLEAKQDAVEQRWGMMQLGMNERMNELETRLLALHKSPPPHALDARMMAVEYCQRKADGGLDVLQAKVQCLEAQVGWMLPQFKLQYSQMWNTVQMQQAMQLQLNNPHVPPFAFYYPEDTP